MTAIDNHNITLAIRRTVYDFDELTELVAHNDDAVYWQHQCYKDILVILDAKQYAKPVKTDFCLKLAEKLSITYCLTYRIYDSQPIQQILNEITKEAYGLLNRQFDIILRSRRPSISIMDIKRMIQVLLLSTVTEHVLHAIIGLLNTVLISFIESYDKNNQISR